MPVYAPGETSGVFGQQQCLKAGFSVGAYQLTLATTFDESAEKFISVAQALARSSAEHPSAVPGPGRRSAQPAGLAEPPEHRVLLCVINGSKALRKAIRDVVPELAPAQRQAHKQRNVREHLPEALRPTVRRVLREAWESPKRMKRWRGGG